MWKTRCQMGVGVSLPSSPLRSNPSSQDYQSRRGLLLCVRVRPRQTERLPAAPRAALRAHFFFLDSPNANGQEREEVLMWHGSGFARASVTWKKKVDDCSSHFLPSFFFFLQTDFYARLNLVKKSLKRLYTQTTAVSNAPPPPPPFQTRTTTRRVNHVAECESAPQSVSGWKHLIVHLG